MTDFSQVPLSWYIVFLLYQVFSICIRGKGWDDDTTSPVANTKKCYNPGGIWQNHQSESLSLAHKWQFFTGSSFLIYRIFVVSSFLIYVRGKGWDDDTTSPVANTKKSYKPGGIWQNHQSESLSLAYKWQIFYRFLFLDISYFCCIKFFNICKRKGMGWRYY